MADMANKAPMSVVVTTSERLSSLLIQNGRLVRKRQMQNCI